MVEDDDGIVIDVVHGPDCPLHKLDDAIARHPVLQRVLDIDFATATGFQMTLAEIDVEEFAVLRLLKSERDKHQIEQSKKPPTQQ